MCLDTGYRDGPDNTEDKVKRSLCVKGRVAGGPSAPHSAHGWVLLTLSTMRVSVTAPQGQLKGHQWGLQHLLFPPAALMQGGRLSPCWHPSDVAVLTSRRGADGHHPVVGESSSFKLHALLARLHLHLTLRGREGVGFLKPHPAALGWMRDPKPRHCVAGGDGSRRGPHVRGGTRVPAG